MRKKLAWVGALFCLVVGGAVWFLTADDHPPPVQKSVQGANTAASANAIWTQQPLAPAATVQPLRFTTWEEYEARSKYGRLPGSLTGINVNWNIAANADGKLVLSADLAALFEFFLSTHTEEGLATSLGRIEEYLRGLLPDTAATEALDILQAYLEYKKGLTRYATPKNRVFTGDPKTDLITTIADVKNALAQRIQARRAYLGTEVADVLFKDDEAYDLYTIRRLEIDTNASLSSVDKEALLTQAEQQLPTATRTQIQQERKTAALNQRIEELRAQGGHEETIRKLRTELYGAQEANRLAVVDSEQAAWMLRLQKFREAKDGVLRQTALTAEAKALSIKEIERASFNPEERMEVEILESVRAQNAKSGPQG